MRIFFILIFAACSFAFPSPPSSSSRKVRSTPNLGNYKDWNPAETAEYLGRFGYISKKRMKATAELGGLIDMSSFSKSIKEFQRMAGLKPTGKMNEDTVRMMSMKRCGVEDTVGAFMMGSNGNAEISGNQADSKFRNKNQRRTTNRRKKRRRNKSKSRSKRYNLEGGRWSKTHLKYRIINYTPDMTKEQVKSSMKKALNMWANYTTLKFSYTDNQDEADINIAFGVRNHGDSYPFDGAGKTLAHAFFPSDGRVHFDDAETFTFKGNSGVNLFLVAAHEFGHALGLAHSSVPNSLMAPFYQGYVPNYTLHPDDIAAIQQLYGKKMHVNERKKPPKPDPTSKPKVTKPTKKPRVNSMNICGKDISFDSMHYDFSKNVMFAFKGIYFWKITDSGVAPGYPKKINRYWKGLPGNINAAVHSKSTGKTYFFKGGRVWRFGQNRRLDKGFPQPSSALNLPSSPDAAMQWGGNGKIYVFKKKFFYQFSEYQRYDGRKRHEKKIIEKYWEGVPSDLEAAFQWMNGKSYFFKGNKYWRFSGINRELDSHYPKNVQKFWIGCSNKINKAARVQTSGKNESRRKNNKNKSNKRRQTKKERNTGRSPILGRLVAEP